jgi:hypothetical protein
MAQRVYNALRAMHGADGCTLDEIRTDTALMTVRWVRADDGGAGPARGEAALPSAEVSPRSCAPADASVGPSLAMTIPKALRVACPSTTTEAVSVIQHDAFGGTKKLGGWALPWWGVAVGVLLAVAFVAVLERARRRPYSS